MAINRKLIDNFLNSNESNNVLGKNKALFIDNAKLVLSYEKMAENNQSTSVSESQTKNMVKSIEILQEIIVTRPLSQEIIGFIVNYCLLLEGWNKSFGKNSEISIKSDFVKRFCQQHLTALEAIDVLRQMTVRAKETLNAGFIPIKLSKEYFDSLKEVLDEPVSSTNSE